MRAQFWPVTKHNTVSESNYMRIHLCIDLRTFVAFPFDIFSSTGNIGWIPIYWNEYILVKSAVIGEQRGNANPNSSLWQVWIFQASGGLFIRDACINAQAIAHLKNPLRKESCFLIASIVPLIKVWAESEHSVLSINLLSRSRIYGWTLFPDQLAAT